MKQSKCKICRRLGEKLFLKGEKCLSAKCAMVKRPFPPGQKAKKRRSNLTEYGREVKEKQKVKRWYNVSESQFKKYVIEVLENKTSEVDVASQLISKLETRLDNIVFRLGWAKSRAQARLLVTHGHFLVNGKRIDIPSYKVIIGDSISLREGSKNKEIMKALPENMKKYAVPQWLTYNSEKIEGKLSKLPTSEDVQVPSELSSIFEHYSR
ncbi:MAG: 30S ribosomal protein S4 [Candidatus Pacebacteria bacterium]|nr:30S ribosomal protein S4 [Candidatus Paceibacterota bacterium]MDD4074257.1 30S ribosomal protein S4 [Candidatus Paceibacterota bacterium]